MNLKKCDKCGKRNIMCWSCEKNSNYQESAWSHDALVKRDAIREFAERLKSSQDAYSWCCADGSMEYCNGDHCESCMDNFKEKIDKIAEQILADKNG